MDNRWTGDMVTDIQVSLMCEWDSLVWSHKRAAVAQIADKIAGYDRKVLEHICITAWGDKANVET